MTQPGSEDNQTSERHLDAALRERDGIPVLDLEGDVDVQTAPVFRQAVSDLMADGRRCILINMANVGFMDSSGFGTLLGAMKRLRPVGGSIHLIACNHSIRRMLPITRLEAVL